MVIFNYFSLNGETNSYEERIKGGSDKNECEKVMKIGYPKLHKVYLYI